MTKDDWTVMRIRKTTLEKFREVKADLQKDLTAKNKYRLDTEIKATDDMTLQRLLKFWFR